MTDRRPPTVPLYIRIPADLRVRIDARASDNGDPTRPWRRGRLQDLVIDALDRAFPRLEAPPAPVPAPEPAPTPAPAQRRRRAAKKPAGRRKPARLASLRNIAA